MKKFLIKGAIFSFPILLLQVYTMMFYSIPTGDLLRLGNMMDKYDYRYIFKEEFENEIHFDNISDINLSTKSKYTFLTLGDSFSEQQGYGYQNYLAKNDSVTIIHFDKFLNGNSIQTLYGILNGDILNKIKPEYIILQTIERHFVRDSKGVDRNNIILNDSLIKLVENKKKVDTSEIISKKLFIDKILRFGLYKILYLLDDNAFGSKTYRVNTKENFFSINEDNKNKLLFYQGDVEHFELNNDFESIVNLNNELNILSNNLSKKGVKLIVLPSPDKFDFYYDFIVENKKYKKPLFFEYFDKMPKNYIYINSKKVLKSEMKNKKDIYFYDDTHWSPWASQIIANELEKIINKNKS